LADYEPLNRKRISLSKQQAFLSALSSVKIGGSISNLKQTIAWSKTRMPAVKIEAVKTIQSK
jgi:hypothetical protein